MDSVSREERSVLEAFGVRPLTRRDAIALQQAGMRYRFGVPDLAAAPVGRHGRSAARQAARLLADETEVRIRT